ncbi:hypothetical protein KHA80_09145 [Anaerobacillus sp. HL2]|nr:hypothetical protein KHA80_09145 [Anaerobacillus sp. HL2]
MVFYCDSCKNVHEYRSLNEIEKMNFKLSCQFCGKGNLKQYPYALIHPNGDINQLVLPKTRLGIGKNNMMVLECRILGDLQLQHGITIRHLSH